MTKDEEKLVKRYLNRLWRASIESGDTTYYFYCLGKIFHDAIALQDKSLFDQVLKSLEAINEKSPEAYKKILWSFQHGLEQVEFSDNIIPFPIGDKEKE